MTAISDPGVGDELPVHGCFSSRGRGVGEAGSKSLKRIGPTNMAGELWGSSHASGSQNSDNVLPPPGTSERIMALQKKWLLGWSLFGREILS
jgi:hypothetical protein